MRIVKILYIDPNLIEKESAKDLESYTNKFLDFICVFTVISNGFIALECLETTRYDLVMTRQNLPNMPAIDLKKIMFSSSFLTPMVLILDSENGESYDQVEYDKYGGIANTIPLRFSPHILCTTIRETLENQDVLERIATSSIIPTSLSSISLPQLNFDCESFGRKRLFDNQDDNWDIALGLTNAYNNYSQMYSDESLQINSTNTTLSSSSRHSNKEKQHKQPKSKTVAASHRVKVKQTIQQKLNPLDDLNSIFQDVRANKVNPTVSSSSTNPASNTSSHLSSQTPTSFVRSDYYTQPNNEWNQYLDPSTSDDTLSSDLYSALQNVISPSSSPLPPSKQENP